MFAGDAIDLCGDERPRPVVAVEAIAAVDVVIGCTVVAVAVRGDAAAVGEPAAAAVKVSIVPRGVNIGAVNVLSL